MGRIAGARARLRLLFARRSAESRMEQEFRFHVEMETEKNVRAGLDPREARRRALLDFGGLERHREVMRGDRRVAWLEDTVQDLRFAVRWLWQKPGFTLAVVSTIAVGVGATTLVFSVMNAVLFRPLPVPDPHRLHAVVEARTGAVWQGVEGVGLPYARYVAYRDATASVFTGLAAHRLTSFSLRTGESAVPMRGVLASGNYFTVAGLRPAAGRFFTADDERSVVLAHHVWRERFGSDPDVAGRVINLDGRPFTVVGVAPRGFGGATVGVVSDLWVPIAAAGTAEELARMATWVAPFGRLRADVDPVTAEARVDVVAKTVPPDEPQTRVLGASLEPLTGMVRGQARAMARTTLVMLLGTAFIVLLIASVNIAGMLLARGVARRPEVAIRVTLGAGRGRLIRQLLAESGVLAVVGGAAGVLLAVLGARLAAATPMPFFAQPIGLDLQLDLRVLGFALALTVLTALFFGFLPALHASRPALAPALKSGHSATATARTRGRSLFVAGQLAMAVFLVVVAGLFLTSLQRTLATGLGYEYRDVVIATTDLDRHGYDEARGRAFYDALVARVRSMPGTESVALARAPLVGGASSGNDMEAASGGSVRREWGVAQNPVDPHFLATIRLPVVAGRGFTDADRAGSARVTVVNETLARRLWPGGSAIGQWVSTHGGEFEVIGVVRDGRYDFRNGMPGPYAFFSFDQRYAGSMTLHVRSRLEPAQVIAGIREAVRAIDADVAVERAVPLALPVSRMHAPQRAATALLGVFGAIALLLAGVGIYGVLAFQVAQRRREFGIRIALGAPPRRVVRNVVGRGGLLAIAGVGAGLALGVAASVALQGILFGVTAFDPITFAGVAFVLAATFMLGSVMPVLQALRVDPIQVLRAE